MNQRIALVGKMCAGKTTLAQKLVDKHGYTNLKFAAGVYEEAYRQGMATKDRKMLQRIGTQARDKDPDHWIKQLILKLTPGGKFVIDDCRYLNEAKYLRENGFVIWRLEVSPEVQEQRIRSLYADPDQHLSNRDHPSETESEQIVVDRVLEPLEAWNYMN